MKKTTLADGKQYMTIVLPQELLDKITQLAEEDGRSRSNYVTRILEDHVKQKIKEN